MYWRQYTRKGVTDVATEQCGICGAVVPYSETVHVTIHTKSEAGVVDDYICRSCYEADLAEYFE